jgi:predicted phage-related endonuclease
MLTEEQKALRRTGMGGTDVRALICPNQYESPMTVWLAKCRPEALIGDAGWPAELGNAMEEPIARWYAKTMGVSVEAPPMLRGMQPSGQHPWMLGSIDRIATDARGERRIVEIKKPTGWTRKEWVGGVPARYVVQSTWYAGVSGIHAVDVVAAIGDDEPVIYPVAFDHDLFASMVEVARAFWHDNVLGNMPPDVDGAAATTDALKAMFPRVANAGLLPADDDACAIGKRMAALKRAMKEAEEEYEKLKSTLCARIGESKGIAGVATWAERKGSVAWGQAAKAHGITDAQAEAFRGEPTRTFSLLIKDEG